MKRFLKFCLTVLHKIKYIGKCRINVFSSIVLRNCSFEGKNTIGDNTYLSASCFGFGSYTGKSCEFSRTKIGKFSSIGSNVSVISANHPLDVNVSTHPAFYSPTYYFSYAQDADVVEHLITKDGYECEIGNDVWIGDNVLIKGGVTIGDGAVVGMGSVVTHDVPPYSIVAGIPAKVIRKRFDDQTIDKLLKIEWWNYSTAWIKENIHKFRNVYSFVHAFDIEEGDVDHG